MPFSLFQIVTYFDGRDPHPTGIYGPFEETLFSINTGFSSKTHRRSFPWANGLFFILGTQCNVCQIVFPPACTGFQEDQSHTCAIVLNSFFLKSLLRSLVVFELVSYCCYNSYHILNDLKQHKFIILQFWRSGILNQLHQTKIQVLARVLSGGSWGKSISFSFYNLLGL